MTRFSFLLALALVLGACDTAAPSSATDATLAPAPMASASAADGVHRLSETVSLMTEGDQVILDVDGQAIVLGAGEAYLIGQTLSRVGYEALDEKLAALFPPSPRPGGDKCEPPKGGAAVLLIDDALFTGGGGGCPPPPPPFALQEPGVLAAFLGEAPVEVTEAPDGIEWIRIPGGFTAPF